MRFPSFLSLSSLLVALIARPLSADDLQRQQFFESKIRPVLVKHCYECHSATSKEIKGSLRVDSLPGLLRGGDSGAAIVAGKPDESTLIDALKYETFEMPPSGKLPKHVVRDFEQWVKQGAFDPRKTEPAATQAPQVQKKIDIEEGRKYWAYQPVKRHPAPHVTNADWPRSDIDSFLLAKLEEAGIKPATDADRRTLIRRLYFDLTGLPPSPEDVAAFLGDRSEDAIERLVDRLLDSDDFGVHWGRHWLDVARYADSNGGDFNATFHNAWKYRDYVIESFNSDKPFDQFVREQIAGDLLPAKTDEQKAKQIIATGFLMIGTKMLSERDKLKLTMDVVDEQINTVGQAFMGLTLGCARCHDHKFDPIPTKDYYALAGIFRSTRTLEGESQQYVSTWPRRELPAAEEHIDAVEAHEAKTKKLQAEIKKAKREHERLAKKMKQRSSPLNAIVVDDVDAKLTGQWKKSTYSRNYVGKGYIHDERSEKGMKWVEFTIPIPQTADYDVQLSYTPNKGRATKVPVSIKHAAGEVEVTVNQERKPTIDVMYASLGKFRFEKGTPGVVTVSNRGTVGYVIVDAVRLVELDAKGQPVVAAKSKSPKTDKTQAQAAAAQKTVKELEAKLKSHQANAPRPLPKAIAVAEGKAIADCEICIRGEHENHGAVAPRSFVQVAMSETAPMFDAQQSGRLQLANWLADAKHPLTARVYVNRIWHHLMGRGIVASVDNFGKLGDRPTHPKLLDRLAADFIKHGWSTKQMVRQIVLSRTYQMSSRHDEAAWNADPENRLHWRANRRRLPAESIRDAMLVVSGQLDRSPAGSPVEGLGVLVTQNNSEQKKFERTESLRRSTYLPLIRSEIPPILRVFDFADPDLVTGRRAVTNVPAQALLLLNSPFVMAQAEKAAARVTADGNENQIERAYELVLSRKPTEPEAKRAKLFLQAAESTKKETLTPLAQLIHTLFASTEFRMLN